MELRIIVGLVLGVLFVTGCGDQELSDAYGQFEADEVTISAEASGKILSFEVEEGMELEAGEQVGLIDTTSLILRKEELQASIRSIQSNLAKLDAQADVYRSQMETARKDLERLEALKKDDAATQKQLDDVEGMINTLNKQIKAVEVQKQSVHAEIETMKTRIAQVDDQLEKTKVINPVNGTVLTVYVEPFELTAQGRPLYQIADTEELILRVYVSGGQLPQVRLGENVEVIIDKNESENHKLDGIISWISSEAEFTPQMIQTKEERVTQMYAVKIRVQNPEGLIKIGMPGEVNFTN